MKMKFFRKTLSFFIVPVMIPILILGMLSGITLNRYMRQASTRATRTDWRVTGPGSTP